MLIDALNDLSFCNKAESTELLAGYRKQRKHFFDRRIPELRQLYALSNQEVEALWGYLLSAEELPTQKSKDGEKLLPGLEKIIINDEFCDDNSLNYAYLGWVMVYWTKAWKRFAHTNKELLSARFVLNKQKAANDNVASMTIAEDELIKELKKVFPEAENIIGLKQDKDINKTNVVQFDKKSLSYFKQHNIGTASKDLIKNFTTIVNDIDYDSSKRIKIWNNPLYIYQMIAASRWLDYTKRFIHVINERPAALSVPIFRQMSKTMAKGNYLNNDCTEIMSSNGDKVIQMNQPACLNMITAKSVLRSGIPLLSSVTSFYVVTWLIKQVHKQFVMNHKEPRKLLIKGDAFVRLGELSGAGTSAEIVSNIRKIIPTLAGCVFQYKTFDRVGEGNFLSYRYEKAIGRNLSFLEIELQPIACPGFVSNLPAGGIEYQEQRQLLPILSVFPFYGRRNEHSSQARFQAELMLEMRPRAKEIYQNGGIPLSDKDLKEIAERAEMKNTLIKPVIDLWIKEECIARTEYDLYTLGARELGAKQMLEQAGKYEIDGSEAGKIKNESKRKKIARKK